MTEEALKEALINLVKYDLGKDIKEQHYNLLYSEEINESLKKLIQENKNIIKNKIQFYTDLLIGIDKEIEQVENQRSYLANQEYSEKRNDTLDYLSSKSAKMKKRASKIIQFDESLTLEDLIEMTNKYDFYIAMNEIKDKKISYKRVYRVHKILSSDINCNELINKYKEYVGVSFYDPIFKHSGENLFGRREREEYEELYKAHYYASWLLLSGDKYFRELIKYDESLTLEDLYETDEVYYSEKITKWQYNYMSRLSDKENRPYYHVYEIFSEIEESERTELESQYIECFKERRKKEFEEKYLKSEQHNLRYTHVFGIK